VTQLADTADVAIIGGGPAGAALAIRLAGAGVQTLVLERWAEPRWRACGVFSSPLTRRRLVELGLTAEQVGDLSRPISSLRLQTTRGTDCVLEYEHGHACGFDRVRLDSELLNRAGHAGAEIRTGTVVRSIQLPATAKDLASLAVSPTGSRHTGDAQVVKARLVVGADGPGSVVARTAATTRRYCWLRKAGITFHRADPDAAPETEPMIGRFVFGDGWYVGIAPVPAGRVNVGIVVPGPALSRPLNETIDRTLGAFPGRRESWMSAPAADSPAVAYPLVHRVKRTAGRGWMLVGDAAGFIDPLTGEGLHRALVSSELAAESIVRWLRGDASALDGYDRRLRARFRNKDVVSWLLQGFLAQSRPFDYALRRLARRTRLRSTFTLAMTDQVRASTVLDLRYLLKLLMP
jgi:flavin-dependent dehydrogenase